MSNADKELMFGVAAAVLVVAIIGVVLGVINLVQLMSGLPWWLNVASVSGYVLLGLVTGRLVALKFSAHPAEVGFGAFLWPITAGIALVAGAGIGSYRLMTRPTKRERLERRHERILEQIAALEDETGIKDAV